MKNNMKKHVKNSKIFEKITDENFLSSNTYLKKKFLAILKNQNKIYEIYEKIFFDENIDFFSFNGLKIKKEQYKTIFYFLYEYMFNNFEFKKTNFKLPHRNKKILHIFSERKLKNFQETDIKNIYRVEDIKNKSDFTIQNYSSAIPPSLLPLKKESIIIDGCAAPGNKTNQLVHICDRASKIYAIEKCEYRFQFLKKRFFNESNVFPINSDFLKIDISPDYILLDVPCSGSGTDAYYTKNEIKTLIENFISKKFKNYKLPKKNYTDENILKFHKLQIELLKHAIMLQPKYICYSTCSIFKKENIDVINSVLCEKVTVEKIVEIEKSNEKIGFFACLLKILK